MPPRRRPRQEPGVETDFNQIATNHGEIAARQASLRDQIQRSVNVAARQTSLRDQIQRSVNIPHLTGADAILEAIDGLMNKLDAQNVNSAARLENSVVTRDEHELAPLHNIRTNAPIPGFPETRGAIATLSVVNLDAILGALSVDVRGGVHEKRARVSRQIGVQTIGEIAGLARR